MSHHSTSWVLTWLLVSCNAGCTTGIVDPGDLDGSVRRDQRVVWKEGGVKDTGTGPQDSASPTADLTAKPGDPCTLGKCAEGLICMANVCHSICSTGCGDNAPECEPLDGCHWVTSFDAACMPGTAQYQEPCGDGVWCVGGNLCVAVDSSQPRCLKLCKYGCPGGAFCGKTDNDCEVCIE